MGKFKKGDKVVKSNGEKWHNGDEYKIIYKIYDGINSFTKERFIIYMLKDTLCGWHEDELKLYEEDTITWNKNTIDIEKYKNEQIVIHCDTEEKAKDLLKVLDKNGIKWGTGNSLMNHTEWDMYINKTCYNYSLDINSLLFSDIDYYNRKDYKIIEWEIVEEEKTTPKKSHIKYRINGNTIYATEGKNTGKPTCNTSIDKFNEKTGKLMATVRLLGFDKETEKRIINAIFNENQKDNTKEIQLATLDEVSKSISELYEKYK